MEILDISQIIGLTLAGFMLVSNAFAIRKLTRENQDLRDQVRLFDRDGDGRIGGSKKKKT